MEEQKEIARIPRETVLLGPTTAVCSRAIRGLCRRPYHQHPKGCPNFGRKDDCPPRAPFFLELFNGKVYVVAVVFSFEEYLSLRRKQHPDWTKRALRNPRHWQGHLRSELRKFVSEELAGGDGEVIFNPEAMGVNVTATCAKAGLRLEWPPEKIVCQVALLARREGRCQEGRSSKRRGG